MCDHRHRHGHGWLEVSLIAAVAVAFAFALVLIDIAYHTNIYIPTEPGNTALGSRVLDYVYRTADTS